jgi:hypothetical protein
MGNMYLSRVCLDHTLISNNYISGMSFNFENEIETGWIVKITEKDTLKVKRNLIELFNVDESIITFEEIEEENDEY